MDTSSFRKELEHIINANSMENGCDTPDFILADYLVSCLEIFDETTRRRTLWYAPGDRYEAGMVDANNKLDRQVDELKLENQRLRRWLEDERQFKNEYQRQLYALLPKTSGVAMPPPACDSGDT